MSAERERIHAEIDELLELLAHDLKNPLAAVVTNLGFVRGALQELDAPQDAVEALLDATAACDSLQRMVGNLELLARYAGGDDADKAPADPPPLDLASIADEAIGRAFDAASARDLSLSFRARDDRTFVRADRDLVARAVDNLLADALQCAPARTAIALEAGGRAGSRREAEITVLDEGPIVPVALRAQILTAAGMSASKNRPDGRYGRGLALYVAGVAARAMGGRVEISERGGRSALVLVLPAHDESASIV